MNDPLTSDSLIYRLLPEFYRTRDRQNGHALRALTDLLEHTRIEVERDIAGLYLNWFVDTCDPWVLPYIGDLVGLPAFDTSGQPYEGQNLRAWVADAIAFRRRKGTFPATEKMLANLTGWPTRLVVPETPGKVWVQTWREKAFAVRLGTPRLIHEGRFTFHPMGIDAPLLNVPRPYPGIEAPFVESLDAPIKLTREVKPEVLSRSIQIYLDDGELRMISRDELLIGDLSDWHKHEIDQREMGEHENDLHENDHQGRRQTTRVIVDPELGRLAILEPSHHKARLSVSYAYAGSAHIGGGPYEREMTPPTNSMWVAYVHSHLVAGQTTAFRNLADAFKAYENTPGNGLIRILDSTSYDVEGLIIGGRPAACFPNPNDVNPNDPRKLVIEALSGEVPCLHGAMQAHGGEVRTHLVLSGLWMEGELSLTGNLELELKHCSIHPDTVRNDRHHHHEHRGHEPQPPAIRAREEHCAGLRVKLEACLIGPLRLGYGSKLTITDSVIDGYGGHAVAGHDATITRTTLLGAVELAHLEAVDAIFSERVEVEEIQQGEVRYSFLPDGSRTPPCVHCVSDAETGSHEQRVHPDFVEVHHGKPGYARLSDATSEAITIGASTGSEMGAHFELRTSYRKSLLQMALDEHLPVGMEAEIKWK